MSVPVHTASYRWWCHEGDVGVAYCGCKVTFFMREEEVELEVELVLAHYQM